MLCADVPVAAVDRHHTLDIDVGLADMTNQQSTDQLSQQLAGSLVMKASSQQVSIGIV